jgi:hypothetical protein
METSGRFPAELRVRRWGVVGLVLLTTLAVGTISLWLVVPYWLIMAWLLTPPGGWRRSPRQEAAVGNSPVQPPFEAEATPPIEPEPQEIAPPAKPARRKRSRSKKKVQQEAPAPNVEATWVRVGPNQFVRVEVPVEPDVEPAPSGSPANPDAMHDPTPLESAESTQTTVEPESVAEEVSVDEERTDSIAAEPMSTEFSEPIDPEANTVLSTIKPESCGDPITPVMAELVGQRFSGAGWRSRSWRPERGARVVEMRRRPLVGVRGLPREPGRFSRHYGRDRG